VVLDAGKMAHKQGLEQVIDAARLRPERYRRRRLPTREMVTATQPCGVIRLVGCLSIALGGWCLVRLRLILAPARSVTLRPAILRDQP
jgi:hypothetical protein